MSKKTEIQVNFAPSDVISSLNFAPQNNQFLIASSWDGKLQKSNWSFFFTFNSKFRNLPALRCCCQQHETKVPAQRACSRCWLPGTLKCSNFFKNAKYLGKLFCFFQDSVHIISGGLDSQLKLFDLNTNTETLLGSHDESIKCVEFATKVNGVATGSWDKVSPWM